jgi:hypothetical protein
MCWNCQILLVGKSTQNDLKFGFTQDKCVITSQQLGYMRIQIECMEEGSLVPDW